MLSDAKWISYAFRVLGAVSNGASSINEVAERIGGSESYIAKVIATLRRFGLITPKYELVRPLEQITAGEVIRMADQSPIDDKVVQYLVASMLGNLNLDVKQVLDATNENQAKV